MPAPAPLPHYGKPTFATNDTSQAQTVADAINEMLAGTLPHEPGGGRAVAIASAYFNVGGWSLIRDQLTRVGTVRLMLGAEPQRDTDPVVLRPTTVPARRAPQHALAAALTEQDRTLAQQRNLTAFTAQARGQVADLITWLRSGKVEVRRYTQEFLHGKAYLVEPAHGVIAGSSNFTSAGLARSRELNLGQYDMHTPLAVRDWYDSLWSAATPFDLAAFYEQQIVPETPWMVFLRMLWEAYGRQVAADDDAAADPSMRNLLPFQRDGVGRARRIMEKYNGVLIADEVGLGKTYVGGALVHDTTRARQRTVVVAPRIIRDAVWRPYVDSHNLGGWVDVISYDDLLRDNPDGSPNYGLPPGRDPDEFALVVLDEAHTVRNGDTERAKRLVKILKGNPRKQVALLTATPVNNGLNDLHSLLSYFIVHDDEFAEMGIPSLSAHFRWIDRMNPEDLRPEHLFDVLDAVAVRRTRRFVRQHYQGQKIDQSGATLTFPEPQVRRVDYVLAPVITGFFDVFAHALGADRDPDEPDPFYAGDIPDAGLTTIDPRRLTLAGYTPSRYQLAGTTQPYEVQVAGLLRSGLLKRFESSGYAFASTCRKMAATLTGLIRLITEEGRVASGESLRDYVRIDLDDPADLDNWLATADYEAITDYQADALLADIRSDIALLESMAATVDDGIKPADDPKIAALAETLVKVLAEAERDSALRNSTRLTPDGPEKISRDRDDRKALVFSYFADTITYLRDNIDQVLDYHPNLAVYRDRVAFVTGTPRPQSGMVTQEQAVRGFAPKTGGPKDKHGNPIAGDRYDLVFTTDVLAEGVNLQQSHNIINYDLPWNPMRLVQRHGRVDRIGSDHAYIYLWCFFPDVDLDSLLGLEAILHRKLTKAAKSIGAGKVLPGVDASDDVVFNARRHQIQALADGDNSLFLGTATNLLSGEEFRAMLRTAIESESLARRLEALPWGIGSGFVTDDRAPGFVFCARILDRSDEPTFRYVALPPALIPTGAPDPTGHSAVPDPLLADLLEHVANRPNIDGTPVDLVSETLSALSAANPPEPSTPAHLPPHWQDLAYKAWDAARADIANGWNDSLDGGASREGVPTVIREAVRHLTRYSSHRSTQDVDDALKVYMRGPAARVTAIVRTVMRDEDMTDRNKTDRLIELIDELGLSAAETKPKRYPISADDVHLIAWTAIIPPTPIP